MHRILCVSMALTVAVGTAGGGEPLPVEYRWLHEPELDFSWLSVEARPILRVAPESLRSPFAKERLEAAQTILRLSDQPSPAHPQLLQALMARLEQGEPQSAVRAACVAAACELDDGTHAERLWKIVREDLIARPTVEQACIRWRSPLPLPLWRSQLGDERSTDQELSRAVKGIGVAGAQEALPLLTEIVSDATQSSPVRLLAAQAIGQLSQGEQLPLARQLHSSSAANRELLALSVLGQRASPAVTEFIVAMADHGTPLAQRHAYQWLCEVHPGLAQEKAAAFARHADAELRRLSLEQLARAGDGADNADDQPKLELLAAGLRDVHTAVRNKARELLLEHSSRSDEHKQPVEELVARDLAQDDWRSLEQLLRLAVCMELATQVPRMIELLEHARPEVGITAAWALRHLATEESALKAMLEHAERLTAKLATPTSEPSDIEEHDLRRVAHLLEAFGIRRYSPAQQMLLKYVPKNDHRMGMITRIAGIWACGKMWEGKENRQLADQLCERITDESIILAEYDTVRYTALLALGFLADPKTRDVALTYAEQGSNPVSYAAAWAVQRIDQRGEQR